MSLAITITSIEPVGPDVRVLFKVTPSGNYVVGGDTLNFATATQDPLFVGPAAFIPSSLAPKNLDVWSAGGLIANGYFPVIGTTQANCLLKMTTAFSTEMTAIAYSAAILADVIVGEAVFTKEI